MIATPYGYYNKDSLVYINDERGNPVMTYIYTQADYFSEKFLIKKKYREYDNFNNISFISDSNVYTDKTILDWQYKLVYTYSVNKIIMSIGYNWRDDDWAISAKNIYKYDDCSKIIQNKLYMYQEQYNEYALFSEKDYIYKDELLIEYRHIVFNSNDSSAIKRQYKTEYYYKTILEVEENNFDLVLEIRPNPITNQININLINNSDIFYANIEIHDIFGNPVEVLTNNVLLNQGMNLLSYNLNLNSGMYYLILRIDHTIALRKFIVMH
jgi:hypothetical protein